MKKWIGDKETHHNRGAAVVGPGGAVEDDSLHYLSEPSVSEDGDSTTTGALERSLLTSEDDDDYDDDDDDPADEVPPPPPPGPPPPRRHDSHGSGGADVASPGNTSLSSWESIAHVRSHNNNHRNNRVRIHFSPEQQPSRGVAAAYNYFAHPQQQHTNYYFQQQQQQQQHPRQQSHQAEQQLQNLIPPQPITAGVQHGSQQQHQPDIIPQEQTVNANQIRNASPNNTIPNKNEATTSVGTPNNNNNPMSYSNSVSTMSSVSTKGRQKLEAFIHDLREQSEGALQVAATHDPSILNTSTDDANSFASPDYLQQQQQQSASHDNQHTNSHRRQQKAAASVTTILRPPPPTTAHNHNNNNNNKDRSSISSRHRRISSVETELIGNTSDAYLEEEEDKGGLSDHNSDGHNPKEHLFSMEESPLKLNLSLLGDEEEPGVGDSCHDVTRTRLFTGQHESTDGGHHCDIAKAGSSQPQEQQQVSPSSLAPTPRNSNTNNSALLGDSNHTYSTTTTTDGDDDFFRNLALESHHSADDEQTQLRPPRKRGVGKPSSLHRRTRSGDGAAAALTTGGHDWKGMFKDKIRLPDAGDDDDEEDIGDHNISNKGKTLNGKALTKGDGNGNAKSFRKSTNINGETALFAMGTPDGSGASRTAARKQRRESRRTIAEKAAAAATERKIKKQYQEWANSPLWKMAGRKNRGGMDSSEISLGSIPSTIEPRFRNSSAAGSNDAGDSHQDEGEMLQRRNSLDTLGSGITMPSVFGHSRGRAYNRRGSTGSNQSIFSWISAFNDDADGSPHSDHHLQVHSNWSPQSASLASPFLHQRKQVHARQHHHQRSNTAMAGSGHFHSERGYGSSHPLTQQQQESFRKLLTQQQLQSLGSDSFRHLSPGSNAPLRGSPGADQLPPPPSLMTPVSDNVDFTRRNNEISEMLSSSDHITTSSSEEEDDEYNVMDNRVHEMHPRGSVLSLNRTEKEAEAKLLKRGSVQHVLRGGQRGGSPFANFGRKQAATGPRKFDRMSFLPKTSVLQDNHDQVDYPTYQCPRCQTIQREFFTVNSAPRQFETASGFLAFAFVAYVIASLYIFGLEVRHFELGFYDCTSSLSLIISIFLFCFMWVICRKDGQRWIASISQVRKKLAPACSPCLLDF